MGMRTVEELAGDLAAGRTTSRGLVEEVLARIADPEGEGGRCFIRVYGDAAREAAEAQDRLRRAGAAPSPLAGIPVSIKDLFDVAGETTLAGSKALDDAPPAAIDSPVVARLRAAGMVIVGRTNMTEFAFSAIGINPHYGTPANPADRKRVPGGSSSGAAVSVADGFAAVAIGSDTGGSVRIPAGLCGLAGFKPTQARVPRDGATPLSTTLDSVGPLARSVADCALVDAVLAGDVPSVPDPMPVAGLRLAVPQTLVLDELEPSVAAAFERACTRLSHAGARLQEIALAELAAIPEANAKGGFSPAEALAWHADLLARRGDDYDPRVKQRIELARKMSAADYVALTWRRQEIISAVRRRVQGFDAMLMPTLPIVAPTFESCANDVEFFRQNGLLLRNTSLINFLDGCALTMPIQSPGELPVGLMLAAMGGADRRLLAVGLGVEAALGPA
jgi:aspartyl-tRNA(Asn)/glutamyl-tRNA(Gln) amidotransferase subunit A